MSHKNTKNKKNKIKKKDEKKEVKMIETEEMGQCCFCGEGCHLLSQSCGRCSHSINDYRLGWKPIPSYINYKE